MACNWISTFLLHNDTVQIPAAVYRQVNQEKDAGGEEDSEPTLRPHICIQRCVPGAVKGHVSGADSLGQRGHVQQRFSGRSAFELRGRCVPSYALK